MLELSEYEQQFLENKDVFYWKQRALRAEKIVKNERVDELSDRYGLPYTPAPDQSVSDMLHNIETLTVLARNRMDDDGSQKSDDDEHYASENPV